ncbi:MAG: CoA pyrophosphatase [Ectothiorhodospiraceae bacterium]|nr:CoA pyrophosphatase [Ectothiorhodospiraceae bacterium]
MGLDTAAGFRQELATRLARHDASRPVAPFDSPAESLRPAAVLLPLMAGNGGEGLQVMLTRRSSELRAHAGQISFPGGRIDKADTGPVAAALREAEEEVGLPPQTVEVLGRMRPYQTGTGYLIHPVVGLIEETVRLRRNPAEVDEIFFVPLAFFLNPDNHRPHTWEHQGRTYHLYAMPYRDYYIWGATAAILRDFYHVVSDDP